MSDLSKEVEKSLKSLASKEKAVNLARFFKTGKGQYGEGDKFMGIVVPDIRRVAKEYYKSVTLDDVRKLIKSPFHEVRLCAVIMLVYQYEKADESIRQKIYDLYLTHTRHINNWDLVDLSAPNIVGEYLLNSMFASPRHRVLSCLSEASCEGGLATHPSGGPHRRRKTGVFGSNLHTVIPSEVERSLSPNIFRSSPMLTKLAKSDMLWERRIAILATYAFIKKGRHEEAFAIAQILLHDKHDLIHKAVGWMLREVGKRVSMDKLREFLDVYAKEMPRTMLRYAIEHMEEKEHKKYLLKSSLH